MFLHVSNHLPSVIREVRSLPELQMNTADPTEARADDFGFLVPLGVPIVKAYGVVGVLGVGLALHTSDNTRVVYSIWPLSAHPGPDNRSLR